MLRLHSFGLLQRVISLVLIFSLAIGPEFSYAQSLALPEPGKMLTVSGAFTPAILKGMVIHPEDPLKFDFLMDTGTNKPSGEALRQEAQKSIKYFLASLTVPEDDLWVNLSPYEKERVVPEAFGKTAMGRDVLAQDYVLKQLASSLLYPENEIGKQFWTKLYAEMAQKTGSTEINMNDFNRVWIVPSEAKVWEHDGKVVILKSRLKVMLETDYSAGEVPEPPLQAIHEQKGVGAIQESPAQVDGSKNILRSILIPALEKEVNEGANFARLRQVYAAMVLSAWYKVRLKESLLGKAYADKNKVTGVEFADGVNKEAIYSRYIESARKGVYNYIREENDVVTGETIPRKYFSGGFIGKAVTALVLSGILTGSAAALPANARAQALAAMPASSMVRIAAGVSDVGANASAEYLADAGKQGIQSSTIVERSRTDAAMGEEDIEALLKRLGNGESMVRASAAKALVKIGQPAIPGLLEALQNSRETVYTEAAIILVKIGQPAIPGLLEVLKDMDWAVRSRTVRILGQIGGATAMLELLKVLKDKNAFVRCAAANALGQIGDVTTVPGLLEALKDKEWSVRSGVAEALGNIGSATAVLGLLEALNAGEGFVSRSAAEALGKIGDEAAVPELLKKLDFGEVVSPMVAEALVKIGKPAIPGLLEKLKTFNIRLSERVVAILGDMGDETAVAGLQRVLTDNDWRRDIKVALQKIRGRAVPISEALKDADPVVRERGVIALGKAGNVDALLEALKDKEQLVRKAAAVALGNIGDEKAVPALLALNVRERMGSSLDVIPEVVRALGNIGGQAAINGLLELLEWRIVGWFPDPRVDSLVKIGQPAIPGLLQALTSNNNYLRTMAARLLGDIGDKIVVPGLLKLLKDEEWEVRSSAVVALGKIGDKTALPELREILKDKNDHVRNAVAVVLGDMGGEAEVPGLLAALQTKDQEYTIAGALVTIGKPAVPGLLEILKNKESNIRTRVAEMLGEIGDIAAVPGLLAALNDPDSFVSWKVSVALGKINDQMKLPEIEGALEVFRAERKVLETHMSKGEWEELVKIGPAALQYLTTLIYNDELSTGIETRQKSVEAIGKIGGKPALVILLWILKEPVSSNDEWRFITPEAAIRALIAMKAEEAIPYLTGRPLLGISAQEAVEALGQIGGLKTIPELEGARQANYMYRGSFEPVDVDKAVAAIRQRVAEKVIRTKTDTVMNNLKALKDMDAIVREGAAIALGKSGDVTVMPGLLEALKDANAEVCRRAAEALGNVGNTTAVPDLLVALKHSEFAVRVEAAKALGRIGDETAVDGLLKAVKGKSADEKKSIVKALIAIVERIADSAQKARADAAMLTRDEAALIAAAIAGDVRALKGLIARGVNVNARGADTATALLHASLQGHLEFVRVLLANGAEIDVRNSIHVTPLMLATTKGHKEIVKLLLEQGADAGLIMAHGLRAVDMAYTNGEPEIAEMLEKAGVGSDTTGYTSLIAASWHGQTDKVRALIASGADVNAKRNDGATALILAASENHKDVVRLLLEHGADVNAEMVTGMTALGAAFLLGYREVGEMLQAAAGEDTDAAQDFGRSRDVMAVPGLEARNDSESFVRDAVAAALSGIGDPTALPGLQAALKDPEWNVRSAAIDALGDMGREAAGIALLKAMKGRDRDERKDIVQALTEISERITDSTQKARTDAAQDRNVGGIDLDAKKLDLQIQRDGKGVALPVGQQDWSKINIQGFVPVIYSIESVNAPMLLGLNVPDASVGPSQAGEVSAGLPAGKELEPVGT